MIGTSVCQHNKLDVLAYGEQLRVIEVRGFVAYKIQNPINNAKLKFQKQSVKL